MQAPYQVNMMVAGYDKRTGPALYYLDYIATLQKLEKGALGFGEFKSNYSLSQTLIWIYIDECNFQLLVDLCGLIISTNLNASVLWNHLFKVMDTKFISDLIPAPYNSSFCALGWT